MPLLMPQRHRQAPLQLVQPLRLARHLRGRRLLAQAHVQRLPAPAQQRQAVIESARHARLQLVHLLAGLLQLPVRVAGVQPPGQAFQPLALAAQVLDHQMPLAAAQHAQAGEQGVAVRADQLRRRRGRGRAHVGGEITQRHVHLVAHRADHRNRAVRHRAHQRLVVERPQVFQAAAAAPQHQHVALVALNRQGQRPADLRRRLGALHRGRVDHHRNRRRPALEHLQHIADRRAAGAGDHPDTPGPRR